MINVFLTTEWNEYFEYFNTTDFDVYFTENYVKLYEDETHKAVCVVFMEEARVLLFPFLRSDVCGLYDFETAYGYGGPVSNCSDESWNRKAMEGIKNFLKDDGCLCGFVRFHPLLHNEKLGRDIMDILYDRHTISINTSISAEEIWATQISSKNRNMIRKAEKNGLVYEAEYDFYSLDEFVSLYNQTMQRLNADSFYFFEKTYYDKFREEFCNHAFLGTIRKDGVMICGALFMYSEEFGHYHLEGSDSRFSGLGANNLLLYKTAVELHNLGVKNFHLGGGYDGTEDNSLLKFKKAFGKIENNFYIGKMVLNSEKYDEIKNEWMRNNPEKCDIYQNRLLCYRY